MKEITNRGMMRTPLVVEQSKSELSIGQRLAYNKRDILIGTAFVMGGGALAVIIAAQSVNQFALVLALTTILWMMAHLKVEYLADLATFYITLLSVAVPLVLAISSQTSERYKSDVITREVAKSRTTRLLLILLFVNVLILAPFRLFGGFNFITGYEVWVAVLSFWAIPMFVAILVLFWMQMFDILALFGADALLNKLLARVQLCLDDYRTDDAGLNLEGIADILLVELQRGKTTFVRKKLREFTDSCAKLGRLEEQSWQSGATKKQLKENERLTLAIKLQFTPGELTPRLSVSLSQLLRMFQGACDAKMPEVAADIASALRSLLISFAASPDNQPSVNQVQSTILQASQIAKKMDDTRILNDLLDWYLFSVLQNNQLSTVYIESFGQNFLNQIQSLVRESLLSNAESVLSILTGGFYEYPVSEVSDIAYFRLGLTNPELDELRAKSLRRRFFVTLDDVAAFQAFLERLAELQAKDLPAESAARMTSLLSEAQERLISTYKHHCLLRLIFELGAYCLFRRQEEFIPRIWYQHQPPDAEANWVGTDIIPQSLCELVGIFFGPGYISSGMVMWDGHHGSRSYMETYFVVLLAHMIQRNLVGDMEFPADFDNVKVTEIEQYCPNLIKRTAEIFEDKKLMVALGFDVEDKQIVFEHSLPDLLLQMIEHAKSLKRLYLIDAPLSQQKIDRFRKEIARSIEHYCPLVDIFAKHRRLLNVSPKHPHEKCIRLPNYSILIPKEWLIDGWLIGYSQTLAQIATRIASHLQSAILKAILDWCEMSSVNHIKEQQAFGEVVLLAEQHVLTKIVAGDFDTSSASESVGVSELFGQEATSYPSYDIGLRTKILVLSLSRFGYLIRATDGFQLQVSTHEAEPEKVRVDVGFRISILRRRKSTPGFIISIDDLPDRQAVSI